MALDDFLERAFADTQFCGGFIESEDASYWVIIVRSNRQCRFL
jgi:hypothetical protein